MKPGPSLDELRLRVDLARGSPMLLLAVAAEDAEVDDARRALLGLLGAVPMNVADLGACLDETGPRRWAELTHAQPADAYVLTYVPRSPLSGRPFAVLLNTERELLRDLAGPLVLVVSRGTEQILRQHAPDFVTWGTRPYELPGAVELRALAGAAPTTIEPAVPAEDPVRFLHISDLHLRPAVVKRYDQDRVLRGLIDFLIRDREGFPLDLIFITGDLAHSGKAAEYALVVELLQKLMEVTGVPIERMFVVPGNHDVDREVGRRLQRTLADDDDAVAFFEDAKSRTFHTQKLAAYRESMGKLLGEGRPLGLAVKEDAVELVEVRGARLAVASFNSAWFAQGEDDRDKLWLGEPNVDRAGQRVGDLEVPFAVALMHHPFDYLHETERDNVEHYMERSFDLVLRGHLHKEKTRVITSPRGGYVEVAGPAAYQGSQWPNGCFLGEIRPKARKVQLRPYMYASGADPWVVDARVFPDDGGDGYCHTFVVPEKRRLKSSVTKQREKVAEDAVRRAPLAELRKLAKQLGVVDEGEKQPLDIIGRTARAARAHADDPVLWQDSDERTARLQLVRLIMESVERNVDQHGTVASTEPRFLERALSRSIDIYRDAQRRIRSQSPEGNGLPDERIGRLVKTSLADILESPTDEDYTREGVVMLIGARGEPDEQHAVVVLKTLQGPRAEGAGLDSDLQYVDTWLDKSHAGHGALVLINARSPTETDPQLERVKTPAGRDVLLLRL